MNYKDLTLKEIRKAIRWSKIYCNTDITTSLKLLEKQQQVINNGWINETIEEETTN
jgi:hypothetical protein